MPEDPVRGRQVYISPHVKVEFKLNREYFKKLAVGGKLRKAVHQTVKSVALPYAVSISPRSDRIDHRHYQDSFLVVDGFTGVFPHTEIIGKPPMLRVGTRLLNTAPHAAAVEWGNKFIRARHILRKTLEHLSQLPHEDNPRRGR